MKELVLQYFILFNGVLQTSHNLISVNYQAEIAGHVYGMQGIYCGHLLPSQIPTLILDTIFKPYLFYKEVINLNIPDMFPLYESVTLSDFSPPAH